MKTQVLGRRTLFHPASARAAFLTQAVEQRAHALAEADNRAAVYNNAVPLKVLF